MYQSKIVEPENYGFMISLLELRAIYIHSDWI